jgi:hypothetical protein
MTAADISKLSTPSNSDKRISKAAKRASLAANSSKH